MSVDGDHSVDRAPFGRADEMLVGDPDQLPSVGAGSVLADLLAADCFPVTRPTKGGKGVATAAGMALVLFPVATAAAAAAWAVIAKLTGKASLASVIAIVVIPAGAAIQRRPAWELATLAAVALHVVARHAPNLRRLARGEE